MAGAQRGIFRALGLSIRLPHHRLSSYQSPAAQLPTTDLNTSSCSCRCLQPCPSSHALPPSPSAQVLVCGLCTPVRRQARRKPSAAPCDSVRHVLTDVLARVSAIAASRVSRDLTVSANETGGFKYVPGGRKSTSYGDSGTRWLTGSDSQGHGQRRDNVPSGIQGARVVPLDIRATAQRRPDPHHGRRSRQHRQHLREFGYCP